jgi:hypothetical protein
MTLAVLIICAISYECDEIACLAMKLVPSMHAWGIINATVMCFTGDAQFQTFHNKCILMVHFLPPSLPLENKLHFNLDSTIKQ